MLDINTLKKGELFIINPTNKALAIYNGKFELIIKRSVAVFLSAEKYSSYLDNSLETFWKMQILLNGKKVTLFLSNPITDNIEKIL